MRSRFLVDGLIIAGFGFFVNAAAVSAAGYDAIQHCGKKPSKACLEFASLVNWLAATGKVRQDYNNRNVDELKLPAGAYARARGVPGPTAAVPDRVCSLIYDKDPSLPDARPVCVLVSTAFDLKSDETFRISLEGRPEMAVKSVGEIDEKGEVVTGSGVITHLDTAQPDIKARMKSELTFWIKRAKEMAKKDDKPAKDKPAEASAGGKSILDSVK